MNNDVKVKKTSKLVIIIILLLSVLFMVGIISFLIFIDNDFTYQEYNKFKYSSNGNINISDKIKITNISGSVQPEWNTYYVSAYVKNVSKHDFDNISVQFSLYDKDDVLLDRLSYDIEDLRKNETWKFSAVYDGAYVNEIYRYELSKVTIY